MAIVVVGGHSRNVGKTSVVAGLISSLPQFRWTALKITQYGHGICSRNGRACHCATADHNWAISEEKDCSGKSDSSRFLLAGAERAFWVRTQQGHLGEAMPALRDTIAAGVNVICESNSIMKFLHPDVYMTVLDPHTADFKNSALKFLHLADAVILHDGAASATTWSNVSPETLTGKTIFHIAPPPYVTPEIADFLRARIATAAFTS
jgi:hypothetical protein